MNGQIYVTVNNGSRMLLKSTRFPSSITEYLYQHHITCTHKNPNQKMTFFSRYNSIYLKIIIWQLVISREKLVLLKKRARKNGILPFSF